MKKLAIAITAVAAFTGSAIAADMPVKAVAAPVVRAVSWTGCYVSAGWGYGMLDDERSTNDPTTFPTSTSAAKGWLGRFGGGCDYQFNSSPIGPIVIGAFGDYDFMNITGNYGDPFNDTHHGTQTMRDAWYAGARAGVLVTPTLLTYINGGWTGAHIDHINIVTASGGSVDGGLYLPAQNLTGWFIGGGTEYAFTFLPIKGVFWKTEYRFASYDSYNQNYVHPTFIGSRAVNNSVDVQTITSSLVWRFWGGP
jgi:outer membrane immunogenic protein